MSWMETVTQCNLVNLSSISAHNIMSTIYLYVNGFACFPFPGWYLNKFHKFIHNLSGRQRWRKLWFTIWIYKQNTQTHKCNDYDFKTRRSNRWHPTYFFQLLLLLLLLKPLSFEKVNGAPLLYTVYWLVKKSFSNKIKCRKKNLLIHPVCLRAMHVLCVNGKVFTQCINTHRPKCLIRTSFRTFCKHDNCILAPSDRFINDCVNVAARRQCR